MVIATQSIHDKSEAHRTIFSIIFY